MLELFLSEPKLFTRRAQKEPPKTPQATQVNFQSFAEEFQCRGQNRKRDIIRWF